MSRSLLVINTGSSSLKFALYAADTLALRCRGNIDRLGREARLRVEGEIGDEIARHVDVPASADHAIAVARLVEGLPIALTDDALVAVGHRVVHGGLDLIAPTRIDADALARIEALIPLAPQHQPQAVAAIRAVGGAWPNLPQVACFDTAFHRTQPRLAQLFALPRELTEAGIVRYGFHGLSYEYIAAMLSEVIGERARGRVIVAHLGQGASLCALRDGQSIATTMGFSPLEGLMMGRRCGRLDPGVILHLLAQPGWDRDRIADVLGNRSGLLGVSGLSDDVRELEASDDPRAREALALFAYSVNLEIGAMVAALGGLDALVFTAGIGEHGARMRQRIGDQLAWLGLTLDADANGRHASTISSASSAVTAHVIATHEELVIARAMRNLLAS